MEPCAKPVSDQTVGDIANCSWGVIKGAAQAVVDNPGGANTTEWTIVVLSLLVILFFLGTLLRR